MAESEKSLQEQAAEKTAALMEAGVDPTSVPLRTIKERSDFDPSNPDWSVLGEDLGGGDFISPPVKVYRTSTGAIGRIVPMNEVADEEERMVEKGMIKPDAPFLAKPSMAPVPLDREARAIVVDMMAVRLWKWYQALPPGKAYNPIRDGIPRDITPGDPASLQPGTAALVPASASEIVAWFKSIIGARAEFINSQTIGKPWRTDVVDTLRIHRNPR